MSYSQLLKTYMGKYWPKVALLAVALFAAIGLQLYSPQIVRVFIDDAAAGAPLAQLTGLAVLFLVVAVANQLLGAIATYLSADVGWGATNALRVDLFRHALHLDLGYHKERTSGEMIERIDGDVTYLANFFSQFAVRVAGSLLLVVGIVVLLWREDWRVGMALGLYVVFVIWVLHRRREVAVPATQVERAENAQLMGFIEERMAGMDDIRANGAGEYVMQRFTEVQRRWYHQSLTAWLLQVSIWTVMMVMTAGGHILALGLGIVLYQAGWITLGTVYLFFNYVTLLEGPLDELSRQLQEFQRAGAGYRRVGELLAERPVIVSGQGAALADRAHSVSFEAVSFGYEDDQGVLKNISFELAPGETMGLLGRTGSGKTTLIRLLFRFYDPDSGRILLDGVDLRDLSVTDLRQRIGLVTQDVQLFRGTVRENLTFFDSTVPDSLLLQTIEALGLSPWLQRLPQGLDTELQAGGSGLSAGEAQLLAFARVFLEDPQVVILDEPSSRLDPETERLITRAIDRLLHGRTGIIIAHRLETVAGVDKIMVLSRGNIVEFGDRRQLAADPSSHYAALLATGAGADLDEQLGRLEA